MRRLKFETAIVALAAISLLVAPALSMPRENGYSRGHVGGLLLLTDDLTKDSLKNMTPAEIEALEKKEMQKLDNMTLSEIKKLKQQKWQELNSTNTSKIADQGQVQKRGEFQNGCGYRAPLQGCSDQRQAGLTGRGSMGEEPLLALLMDDVTGEKLNNMTLTQIRDLKQKKLQELDNMTLGEIKQLAQKKAQERNNMTLAEIRKQNKNLHETFGLLMGAGSEHRYDAGNGGPMQCKNPSGCPVPATDGSEVRSAKP
ncbi:MAG: hypothetical protein A4E48_00340 [Methanosaeta sp. PtaU1.Bin060]|nr:MAG: hypothetical protein A4E48_00340 [Methanosaeta sp. PtaU1.Bin060]